MVPVRTAILGLDKQTNTGKGIRLSAELTLQKIHMCSARANETGSTASIQEMSPSGLDIIPLTSDASIHDLQILQIILLSNMLKWRTT